MNDYIQVCNSCAGDRNLEFFHHGNCESCDATTLVGITKVVADRILWSTYD